MKAFTATAVIVLLFVVSSFGAETTTIFNGLPLLKISEGGVSRITENLDTVKAANLKCIISKIGDTYYWVSRENTKLIRVEGGAFTTFVAPNGAGYIRVINPTMKSMASIMSETEDSFDYVEHALIGLRSVTYYGKTE